MRIISLLSVLAFVMCSWAAYPNGPSTEGTVNAASLLAWVKAHQTTANVTNTNAFANQEGDALTVTLYQLGGQISTTQPIFWQSNMDVDCDGSNNGDCSGFDPSHQSTMSCGCEDEVDANVVPYFVIPGCSDCGDCGGSWGPFAYNQRGINYGQIAAVIYQIGSTTGVCYMPFLDEDGCNTEIGECSAAGCRFLGVNPNPENGGSLDNNVAFIVFPGSANRISDYANHTQAVTVGQAAAAALLGTQVSPPAANLHNTSLINYQFSKRLITINSTGKHSFSVFKVNGENVLAAKNVGPKMYDLSVLKAGTYILKIDTKNGLFTDKIMIY
jgi:hypothetical protein